MIISFKKLWVLFNKRERLQIVGLLIAVICMALAQVIGVASIMPFMNLVMDPGMIEENFVFNYLYNFFQFESSSIFTVFAGLTMVFIIVMSNAISTFAIWYKLKFIWKNNHRLSVKLLKQYMAKPYSYFLIHNSADLGKNVLQEVQTLTRGYLLQLMDFITYGLVTVAIMTFLFVINIKVTLAAIFILGGSYGLIYLITNRKMERAGQKRMEANKYRYKSAAEAFNGIKQLKISSREEKFLSRFTGCSKRYANLCAFHDMVVLLPRYMLEAVASGGVVLLVLYLIVTGEDVKGVVPVVSLFAFAGYRLMPALQKVFAAANSLVFNSAILDRVYEDIFARGEFASILWPVDTPEPLRFCDRIELKGITYTYPDDNSPVLRNIDLCVKHDTAIGLVGATGCGKSTLVNIILGLLRPETGEIVVDGQELNDDRLRNWQLNIGYVAQQIYLSDDTILNNIAFGIPEEEIDFSAVKKAARIAS
ncbi:MAG: ATP-binding cassette domain-containing protein, partial [Halanaerobiales bacterium]